MKTSNFTKKSLLGWGSVGVALVLFLAVNIVAGSALRATNIDLTEDGLFTVSDGTENVLMQLEEPITFRLFFSADLAGSVPTIRGYAKRVEDLLKTYESLTGENFRLEVIDPEPFSPEEDQAVAYGLQGVPLDETGRQFYFGLVGSNTVGDREIIPFFQQNKEPFLEYDLTRMVQTLNALEKPKVGLMTPLPVDGTPGNPQMGQQGLPAWAVVDRLATGFDMDRIETNATVIEDDITVLVLIHPADLPEATLYAIDQFIMRGGRLVVFTDPLSEAATNANRAGASAGGPPVSAKSTLSRLFDTYGIQTPEDVFVGDLGQAQRVNARTAAGTSRAVEYVSWLGVRDGQINRDDVAIGLLDQINIGSAGYVEVTEESGLAMTPLMWTTAQTQLLPTSKVTGSPDPASLLAEFEPSDTVYTIAARISGHITTAYPDGKPSVESDTPGEAPQQPESHRAESNGPANILVIADTDMLDNMFWAQQQNFFGQTVTIPIADNADFLVNAVEQMTGSDELIALRSRGISKRPFTAVDELRRQAELKFQAEEQALTQKVEALQDQLTQLEQQSGTADALVTEEQERAEKQFREELVATRTALRDVQLSLNRDIDRLSAWVQFINIALVPILLIVMSGFLFIWGRRKAAV